MTEPPIAKYRYTLTITGNTLEEVERELVDQVNGGFLMNSHYYQRVVWHVVGVLITSRMEHLNPTQTPENYARELGEWWEARKATRRRGAR